MQRFRSVNESRLHGGPTLGDLLTARPSGLTEPETWAVLCQAVQALQDLFLSDGASGDSCIPLVTPSTLILSSRGRVKLCQSSNVFGCRPPAHLASYLAPEYRRNRQCSDTEAEKMWIYALGETLKRATLTSHTATSRLSRELCQVLTDMTRIQAATRASLMHLLDVISEYCKQRQQNRPFSHIVMDLHQEAMAAIEMTHDIPWGPPAMPELKPRPRTRYTSSTDNLGALPIRWPALPPRNPEMKKQKLTREASTSMENLSNIVQNTPGTVVRPKSMCVPEVKYFSNENNYYHTRYSNDLQTQRNICSSHSCNYLNKVSETKLNKRPSNVVENEKRLRVRKNPVQRVASKLCRVASDSSTSDKSSVVSVRDFVGPEFVAKSTLPPKIFSLSDSKGKEKSVSVVMLSGQKLTVICNPNSTTAGQLFEHIIQKEHIEENFMLGLSALIAGDFVFLPADTRICKAIHSGGSGSNNSANPIITLFLRVRFFLPSLRCIRSGQARHMLYLQLRRSILEHQLPCSLPQLVELDGLALQAEFGDYIDKDYGERSYFLLDHYVPETISCTIEDQNRLRQELIQAHRTKKGLDQEKAEYDFIIQAQGLPHYGGHFYTATWMSKESNANKDVWLYISAQGVNLYERGKSANNNGPQLCEMFEWRTIQTLCYSKHYLCILPHTNVLRATKLKKYKLKMDHKKSYFTFRLASLHHQFFLRLRIEYTSLQSLSQQFGIPLKDMKNETNSLYKLESLSNNDYKMNLDQATVNAETEFKIEFRASSRATNQKQNDNLCKRSKSVTDFKMMDDQATIEDYQNNENENPTHNRSGLILDSSCFAGLPIGTSDKRRGVKMGTRAISNVDSRVSRSMEAVNEFLCNEYLEELSLQSVSLHCSSTSISRSPTGDLIPTNEAYIIDASIKSTTQQFLPDFQETLSESLLEKLDNISFAEERSLNTVTVQRDLKGNLGLQITEGSDGNVYVQSVIPDGPAQSTGNIFKGDQVVAVDGRNLLGMKYEEALDLLKNTGQTVDFIFSRVTLPKSNIYNQNTMRIGDVENLKCRMNLTNINESHLKNLRLENTMNKLKRISQLNSIQSKFNYTTRSLQNNTASIGGSPIEKHLTESCYDVSNLHKYNKPTNLKNVEVPYHKHIRYEIEPEKDTVMCKKKLRITKSHQNFQSFGRSLNKSKSKSCTQIDSQKSDKAVVVGMIPKSTLDLTEFRSLDRRTFKSEGDAWEIKEKEIPVSPIALPRSLGLSRKWRGPVRYPVTPIKKFTQSEFDPYCYNSTSDEEQVFI